MAVCRQNSPVIVRPPFYKNRRFGKARKKMPFTLTHSTGCNGRNDLRSFNTEAETEGFLLRYMRWTALAGNFHPTADYISLVNQNDARAGVPHAGTF